MRICHIAHVRHRIADRKTEIFKTRYFKSRNGDGGSGEKENLKGGTIRNLGGNYLLARNSLKHISETTEYILQYRPDTNERSVLTNVKTVKNKKFLFFKNLFVGLASKEYGKKDFQEIENSKKWNEKFIELKNFREVNSNKRPSSSSADKSEKALYLRGYIARKAFQKRDLDKEKEELLRNAGFPTDEETAEVSPTRN